MATVKNTPIKHVERLLHYIQKDMSASDLIDAKHCIVASAYQDFDRIRTVHNGKGGVQGYHVIQSWNQKESDSLSSKQVQEMGRELVETKWPGHAYVIATHTGTGKKHNHIVVSPWHIETGEKIQNKKRHLYDLRTINDNIARKRSLSVLDPTLKERFARLPERAQVVEKYHGSSWLLDLMQKADFARAHATNYNDYVTLLDGLGVQATVQKKNITYRYPGHERRKRGSKLGRLYDKPGLEKAFRENQAKDPPFHHLRVQLIEEVSRIKEDPTRLKRLHRDTLDGSKRYLDLHRGRPTNEYSIVRYANQEGIALDPEGNQHRVRQHRRSIVLSDSTWTNKGNRTSGTLIDFVAHHKGITFVQAVAKLSNKPELLDLEKRSGPLPKSYRSFYLTSGARAENRIAELCRAIGAPLSHGQDFLKSKRMQVHESGKIRFLSETSAGEGVELYRDQESRWTHKSFGPSTSPFAKFTTSKRKLFVLTDPFLVLQAGRLSTFSKERGDANVLALTNAQAGPLDDFLRENSHVDQVEFIAPRSGAHSKAVSNLFEVTRRKHAPRGLTIQFTPFIKERSGREMEWSIF